MKKAIFGFLAIFCILGANENLLELYQKANEFEKNGETQNAMQIYKKIAEISLNLEQNSQIQTTQNSQNSSNLNPQSIVENSANSENLNLQSISENSTNSEQNELFLGLKAYEPIYVLWTHDFKSKEDRRRNELKFSFSLERPMLYDFFGLDEKISLAYTQTSWWQVTQDSMPFRESNYQPEIFMQIPISSFDFIEYAKFGLMHESNGKDGANSRSWNKAYIETAFKFDNFTITPRIWHSFYFDNTNDDIRHYMGYGDLKLSFDYSGQSFGVKLRNNLKFSGENKGAVQLDWFFPIFNSGFYGYLQYFSGYGESLADYNRHIDKIGLGVAFKQ